MAPADERTARGDGRDVPIISVIVPTYNRPYALTACLRALAAQTLSRGGFEVIVSDDGSTPPVAAAQADLLATVGRAVPLRVVRQANAGPAAARNLGAAVARGRYLAFTDDDCEPAPDWLERLMARYATSPDLLLGGATRNGLPTNPYAAATQIIMDFAFTERQRHADAPLFPTNNLSLPAAGFRAIHGFSGDFPDAGEDYDLCYRWLESGRRAGHAPDAVITHYHQLTGTGFLALHVRYGRGLLRVRRQSQDNQPRRRRPELAFHLRLLVQPLRNRRNLAAWRQALLIVVAQLATITGAVWEFVRPMTRSNEPGVLPAARTEWLAE